MMKRCGNGSGKVLQLGDEAIVCEILSRLPVKSLMRFQCVCRSWRSLIRDDRHFIDLHCTRSQTRSISSNGGGTSLLIEPRTGDNYLLVAELLAQSEGGDTGGATILRKIPGASWHSSVPVLRLVNGLICYIDSDASSVCVYNPRTRESTPWIKSIILQQHEQVEDEELIEATEDGVFFELTDNHVSFGYDPAAKEHKVISIWSKQKSDRPDDEGGDWLCEIMTVRCNSWRLIDAVPPISPFHLSGAKSICVSGSIYWLHYGPGIGQYSDVKPLIVEFNVGREEFRVISLPNVIISNNIDVTMYHDCSFMEIDGHLVLLAKEIHVDSAFDTFWVKRRGITGSTRVFRLYNDQDERRNKKRKRGACNGPSTSSSSSGSNNYYWMEDFSLTPLFDQERERLDFVAPIPGTNLFLVGLYHPCSFFYYYNWKQKSFSNKFQINGFNLFVYNLYLFDFRAYIFQENLLPVN